MFVLVVAAATSRKVPAVVEQEANDVAHFHVGKLRNCF
jgi:hypothetical protein